MKVLQSFKMSGNTHPATQCHVPGDNLCFTWYYHIGSAAVTVSYTECSAGHRQWTQVQYHNHDWDVNCWSDVLSVCLSVTVTDQSTAVLYCTDQSTAVLYCTDQSTAVLYCTDQSTAVLYCTDQSTAVLYCTDQSTAVLYSFYWMLVWHRLK